MPKDNIKWPIKAKIFATDSEGKVIPSEILVKLLNETFTRPSLKE